MKETEINIEEILKHLRELVGSQAQEIAILRATVEALNKAKDKVE